MPLAYGGVDLGVPWAAGGSIKADSCGMTTRKAKAKAKANAKSNGEGTGYSVGL
jgi:hypothetical protein